VNGPRSTLEQQFNELMSEYGAAIARLASSYEAIPSVREELMQEIALAIWQALPHFRGESTQRTFIFRIAHNRGLSHVWKRRPIHQALQELDESDEPVDPRPHPEEQAAQVDQRSRLLSAVQSLPAVHRQMIVLMLEGLSHAEMAEVIGITENAVAVRLNRARQKLKELLGEKS
jgi:RNA polymerase sigma-70 factor (ECF subfamily)